MRIGVVTFPGSCDDRDARRAVALVGAEPVALWHGDADLAGVDAVVLPGGFSYGDYLRCGAIARFSPVMGSVAEFAQRGGPVLGICNGFQVLCEAGLLPGALTRNKALRFIHRLGHLRVERRGTWMDADPGEVLKIPVKHGEGRFVHPDPQRLLDSGQVFLRYSEPDGTVGTEAANPNGSVAAIAGVTNEAGNVAGLMPHPEHAVEEILGPTDGRRVIGAVLSSLVAR
jgi:phosphoribosylformylglycinamidine synthase subunit PurQ / glutaminase